MRARYRLRLREVLRLADRSHLRVYEGPNKLGQTTFAHVTEERYQIFTTNLEQWLAYYGLSLEHKED